MRTKNNLSHNDSFRVVFDIDQRFAYCQINIRILSRIVIVNQSQREFLIDKSEIFNNALTGYVWNITKNQRIFPNIIIS